jgi:hypothetical protein
VKDAASSSTRSIRKIRNDSRFVKMATGAAPSDTTRGDSRHAPTRCRPENSHFSRSPCSYRNHGAPPAAPVIYQHLIGCSAGTINKITFLPDSPYLYNENSQFHALGHISHLCVVFLLDFFFDGNARKKRIVNLHLALLGEPVFCLRVHCENSASLFDALCGRR